MAATPEGRVKDAVRKVLKRYTNYNHWPVPYGYGNSTIDALVCVAGYFVGIETKAPGEVPTERQKKILGEIEAAGGVTFVIDGADKTGPLEEFLKHATQGKEERAAASSVPCEFGALAPERPRKAKTPTRTRPREGARRGSRLASRQSGEGTGSHSQFSQKGETKKPA